LMKVARAKVNARLLFNGIEDEHSVVVEVGQSPARSKRIPLPMLSSLGLLLPLGGLMNGSECVAPRESFPIIPCFLKFTTIERPGRVAGGAFDPVGVVVARRDPLALKQRLCHCSVGRADDEERRRTREPVTMSGVAVGYRVTSNHSSCRRSWLQRQKRTDHP